MIEIALDAGECWDYGWHTWIDNKCECGVKRHETNGNYWYSRGM